eukprot:CAMPEP_0201503048 /NCGR_PEP_ID=MMETSP0151_2-20130828/84456_1 /ASSEMBLY_ACC=CAM_ASM_000257 /TAXON_ID=200890 /ORGANISM="Paramoeba atlantica, Strain 621/1 / CCAP 1560/9" /LENGTH=244 /DNA_ID=CAMNT_0047896677 /DNA_START=990 /DNA_END=1725 /DNA_ORIENTATION=-
MTQIQRLFDYSDLPSEDELYKSGLGRKDSAAEKWPSTGSVSFSNVAMKYQPSGPHVLKNVSFQIEPGESIGIVGRTGAGKSSLFVSLLRIFEICEGKITIDDVDISHVGLHDLRHNIISVPQEPFLISGTVRQNLDPFQKKSDFELFEALESVNMRKSIDQTPQNLTLKSKQEGEIIQLVRDNSFLLLERCCVGPGFFFWMKPLLRLMPIQMKHFKLVFGNLEKEKVMEKVKEKMTEEKVPVPF